MSSTLEILRESCGILLDSPSTAKIRQRLGTEEWHIFLRVDEQVGVYEPYNLLQQGLMNGVSKNPDMNADIQILEVSADRVCGHSTIAVLCGFNMLKQSTKRESKDDIRHHRNSSG
jgi:hypothetical protein